MNEPYVNGKLIAMIRRQCFHVEQGHALADQAALEIAMACEDYLRWRIEELGRVYGPPLPSRASSAPWPG